MFGYVSRTLSVNTEIDVPSLLFFISIAYVTHKRLIDNFYGFFFYDHSKLLKVFLNKTNEIMWIHSGVKT